MYWDQGYANSRQWISKLISLHTVSVKGELKHQIHCPQWDLFLSPIQDRRKMNEKEYYVDIFQPYFTLGAWNGFLELHRK